MRPRGSRFRPVGLVFINGGTSTGRFEAEGAGDIIEFGGGTHDLNSTSNLLGLGEFRFSAGTTNFNAGSYVAATTRIAGGTANFNSAASTELSDLLRRDPGWHRHSDCGRHVMGGRNVRRVGDHGPERHDQRSMPCTTKDISQRTVTNNGTVNWSDRERTRLRRRCHHQLCNRCLRRPVRRRHHLLLQRQQGNVQQRRVAQEELRARPRSIDLRHRPEQHRYGCGQGSQGSGRSPRLHQRRHLYGPFRGRGRWRHNRLRRRHPQPQLRRQTSSERERSTSRPEPPTSTPVPTTPLA